MSDIYKIEIFTNDSTNQFIWCIIKQTSTTSFNVGHGMAKTLKTAMDEAYSYYSQFAKSHI